MFQDQLPRNSQNALSWYIGWERYVLVTSMVLGVCVSAGVSELRQQHEWNDGAITSATQTAAANTVVNTVEICGPIKKIATWMIVAAGHTTTYTQHSTQH